MFPASHGTVFNALLEISHKLNLSRGGVYEYVKPGQPKLIQDFI